MAGCDLRSTVRPWRIPCHSGYMMARVSSGECVKEKALRNLAVLSFAAVFYALMGIDVAEARDDSKKQQRPDSIVTCQGSAGGGYAPINVTTSTELNLVDCTLSFERSADPVIATCFSCVRSLEKQGCKVLDVVITNFPPASGGGIPNQPPPIGGGAGLPDFPIVNVGPRASFVLSCESP